MLSLMLEVKSYHICLILLVRSESIIPSCVREGNILYKGMSKRRWGYLQAMFLKLPHRHMDA